MELMELDAKLELVRADLRKVRRELRALKVDRIALTRQEAASACGVSPASVDRVAKPAKNGNLVIGPARLQASYLFGDKPVFLVADIKRALEAHKISPA